jgi:fructokinase
MSKRRIITIGETLLDILFKNQVPVAAKAGGSMLNTTVSLGRLGLPVHFISEMGVDEVGTMVENFLNENGIDTSSVNHYTGMNTTLALAFLDEQNNAGYSFYKDYPELRLRDPFPEITDNDILLFGSFFALAAELRPRIVELLKIASKKGALIIYDPNFRKNHLAELNALKPIFHENFSFSNLVKGSDDDFKHIFNANDIQDAYAALGMENLVLIYTANSRGVWVKSPAVELHYPVNKIEPVSTIGAGDTFSAGIIYGLFREDVTKEELPRLTKSSWDKIVPRAIDFATEVCLSYENYISKESARKAR